MMRPLSYSLNFLPTPDLQQSGAFITCLADDGCVLADAGVVAATAGVLAEDPEDVLVAHDQVRHGASRPAVVLEDGEPFLEAQRAGERLSGHRPVSKPAPGFPELAPGPTLVFRSAFSIV